MNNKNANMNNADMKKAKMAGKDSGNPMPNTKDCGMTNTSDCDCNANSYNNTNACGCGKTKDCGKNSSTRN